MSQLTKSQFRTYVRVYHENGTEFRLTATVRYDDQCGNGHNKFSVTGSIDRKSGSRWVEYSCGCIHEDIAKRLPELAPLIKWHLCSSDGPLHYPANAIYHAGDRDHWGLRKGEFRQFHDRKTGKPAWILEDVPHSIKHIDATEKPAAVVLNNIPYGRTGEGKERNLEAARSCAIWPEATDEDLTSDDLEQRLKERLPSLLAEFRAVVESLGFTY